MNMMKFALLQFELDSAKAETLGCQKSIVKVLNQSQNSYPKDATKKLA